MRLLVNGLAVALTCGVIAWAADLFRRVGFLLYTEQYLAGMLAIAMPLVFLHLPARREKERAGPVPWHDIVAAGLSAIGAAYMAVRYPILSELVPIRPTDGTVVAAVMAVLFIEGLRRTTGLALTGVVVGFLVLALVGHRLPGVLAGRPVDLGGLLYYLVWDSTAILGVPMKIVTTIVIAFVFFGQALLRSGGSTFFTDISMALMGRYRGGPAKISVLASSLFGTISGSVVSNVVTTGVITIPMMKQSGFRPYIAGAVEAVASTGGQLMPPVMGVAAFLMAEFLEAPYREVALAALIPALLYYAALFIQTDLEAAQSGMRRVDEKRIPNAMRALRSGWFFAVPFVVLIGALFWLNYSPETAALLASAVILVAGVLFPFQGKRMGVRDLVAMLRVTGLSVLDLFMIGAAAGMVIGVLNATGLGFGLTLSLVQLAGGNLFQLLVLTAVVCILLGMGMPTVGVYILLATLVAPALIEMKINPMAAHMFIFYYGMLSMITPPVAIGAFAAANLAGASPMRTGFAAMRLGWTAFVIPFLFVFSGTLLMQGDPGRIVIDFVAAILGVWLVSIGLAGYFMRPVGLLRRFAFAISGLLALIPAGAFPGAVWTDIVGVLGGIALVSWEIVWRRRIRKAEALPQSSIIGTG